MEHNAADQLDIEMAHVEDAAPGLAPDREGLYQDVVKGGTVGEALFEALGFLGEVRVGELLELWLEIVDRGDEWAHRFDFALGPGPKYFCEDWVEHKGISLF